MPSTSRSLILGALLVLASACRSAGDKADEALDDTASGSTTDDCVGPVLEASHEELVFGPLQASSDELSDAEVLILTNVGCSDLHISSLELEADDGGFAFGDLTSLLLNPSGSTQTAVSYRPSRAGEHEDTLLLVSDDPVRPVLRVPLRGSITAPELSLWAAEDAWSDTVQGCPADDLVHLENVGNDTLLISEISLTGDTLSYATTEPALPWSLAEGDGGLLKLRFSTDSGEPVEVGLSVTSSDPFEPVRTLSLSLHATPDDPRQERFTVGAPQPTDIVLMVDTSCSMGSELAGVFLELEEVFALMETTTVDARLLSPAWGTGCLDEGGLFMEDGDSAAVGEAWLESFETVGAYQGGEQALGSLARWLSSTTTAAACNEDLLVEGGVLQLLSITDEPDQTSDMPGHLASIQATLEDPRDLVINTVAGTYDAGCDTALANLGLYELVVETGGTYGDLCFDGWGADLAALLDQPARLQRTFPLSETPLTDSVAVSVDGVPQVTGWTWEESSNSVVFDEGAAPAEGATVILDYVVEPVCDEG